MPGGQRDAEAEGEAVAGSRTTARARSPRRGRSAGCRGRRRSPRTGSRRRTRQPSGSISRALARNAADQQHDGAPVAAGGEVDVLAALGLAAAAAQHVDGEQRRRTTSSSAADDDRDGLRADRADLGHAGADPRGVRQDAAAERRRAARRRRAPSGHSVLGAARAPAQVPPRWRVRSRCVRPRSSSSTSATRSFCSVRNVANSSPVRKASVQPVRSSASFHSCAVVHLRRRASTSFCVSASRDAGGATMPRQLVNTRSTPGLLQRRGVDAARPARLAGDREDADVAGLDLARRPRRCRSRRTSTLPPRMAGQQLAAAVVGHVVDLAWGRRRPPARAASAAGGPGRPGSEPPPTGTLPGVGLPRLRPGRRASCTASRPGRRSPRPPRSASRSGWSPPASPRTCWCTPRRRRRGPSA